MSLAWFRRSTTVYEGACATREDAKRLVAEVSRRYGRVAYITHEPGRLPWHVFSTLRS